MDLARLEVDLEKEQQGVWIKFDDDTELLVARLFNERYMELQKTLIQKAGAEGKTVNKKDLIGELLAKTCLLGWKGLKYKGEDVAYSEEKSVEYITNPSFKEFREWVFSKASDLDNYRKWKEEEIAKN